MPTRTKTHDVQDPALLKRIIDNAFGISRQTANQTRDYFCNVGRLNMRKVQFADLVEHDGLFRGRTVTGDLWQFTSIYREG